MRRGVVRSIGEADRNVSELSLLGLGCLVSNAKSLSSLLVRGARRRGRSTREAERDEGASLPNERDWGSGGGAPRVRRQAQ
jgi:hypothetical protein